MNNINYDDVMRDVRQAWRMVAAYQQRVFYLLQELERGFPELSMTYWEPARYDRPPQGRTPPWKKWVWDGLPYYGLRAWFTQLGTDTKHQLKKGDWYLWAQVYSDTGFDEHDASLLSSSFSGPDPAKMPPVAETRSELWVYVYQVTDPLQESLKASDIWWADDNKVEPLKWCSVGQVPVRRKYWMFQIAELLGDGGMQNVIQTIRQDLRQEEIVDSI